MNKPTDYFINSSTTKKELITKAISKGFNSVMFSNSSLKHSNNEDTRYLLWMSELQEWVRSNTNISPLVGHTFAFASASNIVYFAEIVRPLPSEADVQFIYEGTSTISYANALEEVLIEALNYVKDGKD